MTESLVKSEIRRNFEWLHVHPELGYQEYETTNYIKEQMKLAGIEILDLPLKTGLVAQINGKGVGKVIGLRCDIDALPIQEETELSYISKNLGVMHACGHDFHTAVMIGVAKKLNGYKERMNGAFKIIFQPAEEAPGGAYEILKANILEDVSAYIGYHATPGVPVGTVGIREGAVMAAVDRFEIKIQGRGTHAAHPDQGIDPIVIVAAIIQSVQTIVSRNMNPFHSNLVSITRVESGNTWNVIPEKAFMEGTVRTLDHKDRQHIKQQLESIVTGIAQSYGGKAEVHWHAGPPAVCNDSALCDIAKQVANELETTIIEGEQSLGGEDFSLYLEKNPGIYMKIGTGGENPLHHPGFLIDTDALEPTVELVTRLALKLLE